MREDKVEGDAAGTRALIEVLLLHQSMQATDVIASITRPLPSLAACCDELRGIVADRDKLRTYLLRVAMIDKPEAFEAEYVEAHVRCTCGNEFTTRSTQSEIHVEICSNCHPFYTGKQKILDTGGRVARFEARYGKKTASK